MTRETTRSLVADAAVLVTAVITATAYTGWARQIASSVAVLAFLWIPWDVGQYVVHRRRDVRR